MLHSVLTKIHVIENWTYANAAARTGATGFVSGDIGKVAYQQDDGSYWRLTATTPTWAQVGGLPVSTFFRIKSDGSFQLYNTDQSKWHTLTVRGTAGAEYITIGAGET